MSKISGRPERVTPKHFDPTVLSFNVFTADDIRNLSVTKILTPLSFNILGHPLKNGLYDPALGPLNEKADPCGTCGENVFKCPGHFGHIELPMPVVNPLFHKVLCSLIKLSCLTCYSLQIPEQTKLILAAKLRLLREGFYTDPHDLDHGFAEISQNQQENEENIEYVREKIKIFIEDLYSKRSCDPLNENSEKEINTNTKNMNMQWHMYVETVLKQCTARRICMNCKSGISKVTILKNRIMMGKVISHDDDSVAGVVGKMETILLMSDQSKEHLQKIWKNENTILKVLVPCLETLDLEYPTDVFFFEVIPVLPPIVRPTNILDGQIIEHPQSQVYKSIIQDCLVLRNIIQSIQDGDTTQLPDEGRMVFEQIRGNNAIEKLHNAWQGLQANIDHLMDREMSKTSESANCQGMKQVIEKKDGIIRMHMMGKRVDFAARSVITPDPNLNIDEIGIPEAFAKRLTYPVPVTPWNVTELRQLIMNGPDQHPGAVMIEGENNLIRRISPNDPANREAIAKRLLTTDVNSDRLFDGIKIVHRHLQNGDILLLNRQPTLHKPSIMAHKARILKGEKTLRLHYANCKAYNADFDGDEMNAHFPQNELARSEGYNIANVSNQYLVPKDGTPLGGLIQDHVISGVKLTLRGHFFSKQDYMELVYAGLSDHQGEIILLPPAIIKPVQLWSGKQIVSTVIINIIPRGNAKINLTASAKIGAKEWEVTKPRKWNCGTEFNNPKTMSEAEVVIRNGELHSGVLDKTHYGATPYGLIHCTYELYGGPCSGRMLSSFGKLFQAHLQYCGFTLGVHDILILDAADAKRHRLIKASRKIGDNAQKAVLELPKDTPREEVVQKMEESFWSNPKFRGLVDREYKTTLDGFTNDINKTCLPAGLVEKFPGNNLQLMVQSGAKGSTVNTMQISCLLGQIELEGKRPPIMMSGKSLPSFPAYDSSPRAGGFIDGRFMTGIQPQEFFFHCMAGREGLIDTAVKTSRSGYLQRCLIKHFEGLSVHYDSTVRDSDGSLIQMNYGEDGLDISASRFLRKEQIDFLVENKKAILKDDLLKILKESSTSEQIKKSAKKLRKWTNKNGDVHKKRRSSGFSLFSAEADKPTGAKYKIIDPGSGRSKETLSLMKKWIYADKDVKKSYENKCIKCPDPLISRYRQDIDFGVLTEHLEGLIDGYMKTRDNNNSTKAIDKEELRDLMCLKIMKTLCPPGEPVGLLAAQSIGEPSTQMTLNTFHFAGRGEMNVTLGIPRLREILMMASKNIKTPSMEIPFKHDLPNLLKQSNKLRLKLTKCVLHDVLKTISIDIKTKVFPHRRLEYTLDIELLPHKYYKNEFGVNSKIALRKIETTFFKEFFKEIKKLTKISRIFFHLEEEKKRNVQQEDSKLDEAGDDPEPSDYKKKVKPDLGEMHESSDEDEASEDADATSTRLQSRRQENNEYEDPEDEEMVDEPTNNVDEEEEKKIQLENSDEDEDNDVKPLTDADKIASEQRKKDVLAMHNYGIEYDYDIEKSLWCKFKFWLPLQMMKIDMPTVVHNVARKVILWQTPEIRRAFTFENNDGDTLLKTDGLNIVEMFKYNEILNLNKLYSNDIYGISRTYGIEAANRVILKEVKDVFKMYGITVDSRHLSLIADYMTFDGSFQPLSRKGMEDSASPLQQMSFESSLNFLKNATLQGKRDDLISPSSRLMLGQPFKCGTGAFGVYLNTQMSVFSSKSISCAV